MKKKKKNNQQSKREQSDIFHMQRDFMAHCHTQMEQGASNIQNITSIT